MQLTTRAVTVRSILFSQSIPPQASRLAESSPSQMSERRVVSVDERDRNVLLFQYVVNRAANRLALVVHPEKRFTQLEEYKSVAQFGLLNAASLKGDNLTASYAMTACKNAIIDFQRKEQRFDEFITLDCELTRPSQNEHDPDFTVASEDLDIDMPEASGIEGYSDADASQKAIAELTLANIVATATRGLMKLPEPMQTILWMGSYLNPGGKPATLREIAAVTGLSLNKVFRLRKEALEALKVIKTDKQSPTVLSIGKSPVNPPRKGPRQPFENDKAFWGTICRDTRCPYVDEKSSFAAINAEREDNPKRGVGVKDSIRKCEHGHYWPEDQSYAWACFDDTNGIAGKEPVSCQERYNLGLPLKVMPLLPVKNNGIIVSEERAKEIKALYPEDWGRPMFDCGSQRTNYKGGRHSSDDLTTTEAYKKTRLAWEVSCEPQSSALSRNSVDFLPESFYGRDDHFVGWMTPNGEFPETVVQTPIEKAKQVNNESLSRAAEYNEWYDKERPAISRPGHRDTTEYPTTRSPKTEGK